MHRACIEALASPHYVLVIPALCVAEASYLMGLHQGPRIEAAFLRGLVEFDVQAPSGEEWDRMAALVDAYADFPLGGTDASVIVLAERLRTDIVITLDRRHFSSVKPAHCKNFKLLP